MVVQLIGIGLKSGKIPPMEKLQTKILNGDSIADSNWITMVILLEYQADSTHQNQTMVPSGMELPV